MDSQTAKARASDSPKVRAWGLESRWAWVSASARMPERFAPDQHKRDRRERGRKDNVSAELCHRQRPHSMLGSLPSSTGGVTVGVASAYWVTVQSPAAAAQFAAKFHDEWLVL